MEIKNPFITVEQSLIGEKESRKAYHLEPLTFGIKFLDDCLGGIFPKDLILFTSATGIGKTEAAVQIAQENAAKSKRVHFFALEAESDEIIRRIKYKKLVSMFYNQPHWKAIGQIPDFTMWLMGKQEHLLSAFEEQIDEELRGTFKNLFFRYRVGDFTADHFQKEVQLIQGETDLIICDHLHYFDHDDINENKALKETVKSIRDVALIIGKPVVLLAHVRKSDRKNKVLIPGIEDVHGSSDIGKIVTRGISIAPAYDQETKEDFRFPTYVRILKNRINGARTRYAGLLSFNSRINKYDDAYFVGKLNYTEDEFQRLEAWDYPDWARRPNVL